MKSMEDLINYLIKSGVLRKERFIDAFRRVDRKLFMWPGFESEAYMDNPTPLGDTGQTISAPHIHAYYLESLDIGPDDIVLEVGSGSGYLSALAGAVIDNEDGSGHVYSIEYNRELYEFSLRNIREVGLENVVTVIYGDGSLGWPPKASKPIYNKIMVSAAASKVPRYLISQLRRGGAMLIPIGGGWLQTLYKIMKSQDGNLIREPLITVAFVPMKLSGDDEDSF